MTLQEIVASLAAVPGLAEKLPVAHVNRRGATWWETADDESWPISKANARAIVDGVCCRYLADRSSAVWRGCTYDHVWWENGEMICTHYEEDFTEAAALACVAIGGGA